ncbi:hypothetical protein A0H81_07591 [Grifola frondosa]|uniref:Uncharacterized protein n=1 Tax=Grifola frondosa TaxID=5627 RepID=A0A1C7M528_GRIFR|nr:hypothetical protein A0H81_07591 [Grifola frondosa]
MSTYVYFMKCPRDGLELKIWYGMMGPPGDENDQREDLGRRVAATLRLIAFAAFPGTGWFISADFVMGKLYANSLMAALNVRRSHQHDTQGTQAETAIFSSVPDVSTHSQGSVVPASFTPPPRRPIQRAPSALDIIFVDEKGRDLREEREKREKARGSSSLDMI